MMLRRLVAYKQMKNAVALDDDDQQASQASTAAQSDESDCSDCEYPTCHSVRRTRTRRAEMAATASSHDRSVPRRKTAAEIHQIFDVPCKPLPLEKKLGAGAFGTVFRSRLPSSKSW